MKKVEISNKDMLERLNGDFKNIMAILELEKFNHQTKSYIFNNNLAVVTTNFF